MKKISTLFKKNPDDLGRVVNEINPGNEWILKNGIPTQKFDGTACAIFNGILYKRYDAKIDKKTGKYKRPIPGNAIPCQKADLITGHHPHWVYCNDKDNSNKYHIEAFKLLVSETIETLDGDELTKFANAIIKLEGTYELCGEKVQSNPEKIKGHRLVKHGSIVLPLKDFSFESIKEYLSNENNNIEGIVFHHKTDDRMCKIRKCDFGVKR